MRRQTGRHSQPIPPILNRFGVDPGRYLHHMGGKSKLTQRITAIGPLVGSRSRRYSRSLAPGAVYRLHPCNRTSGIHAVERIRRLQPQPVSAPQESEECVSAETASVQPPLMPLVKASQDDHVHVLGYTERDYLELVDWAGRAIRADKLSAIPSHIPPILNRLGLDPGRYLHHMGGKSKFTQHITAIGPCSARQAIGWFLRGMLLGKR